jgi:hypothetical protein
MHRSAAAIHIQTILSGFISRWMPAGTTAYRRFGTCRDSNILLGET